MSSTTFADLGVSERVRVALDARGITTPFPVQQLVLPVAATGRDVLVSSPTGSGKTLAFGLPLIDRVERPAKRPGRSSWRPPGSSPPRSRPSSPPSPARAG